MTEIENTHLQDQPTPTMVVVDTCSLFDIVRAPILEKFSVRHIESALWMLDAMQERQPCLQLAVDEWVLGEYRRSIDGVSQHVKQQLEAMWAKHDQATGIIAAFNGRAVESMDARAWVEGAISRGKQIVEEFLAAAANISASDEDERRANLRTKKARPPSCKGKGTLADAVLTEWALRLAGERASKHSNAPVILLSSNTNDFCEGKMLKPELQMEFDAVGLRYAPTWSAARYACPSRAEDESR